MRTSPPATSPPARVARGATWLAAAGLLVLNVGCGAVEVGGDTAGDGPSGEVLVFAAASLTEAFDALAAAFMDANPEVAVTLNLAGSQTLASQITEGAPADVFASANTLQMDAVAAGTPLAGEPEVFTGNRLAIVVEAGNPLGIEVLDDLADDDLLVVLPTEEVPAGRYARRALDAAGVAVTPVSLERDVRAALAKVALGEADASIVYVSDLVTAGERVAGVGIPAEDNVTALYPIVRLDDAPNPVAADAFVAFVLSERGRAILAESGFTTP